MGDLEERFHAIARTSPLRARFWYWRQALSAALLPLPGSVGVLTGASPAGVVVDLAQAVRALRRRPIQAATAALTLGLGIGVVGTAFSILWGTVLRGLPFEEAEQLVHFERANPSGGQLSLSVTPHDYLAWKEAQGSFEDLGAYVEAVALIPSEGAPPERYLGVYISANSFSLLRVQPAVGRAFSSADEQPRAAPVVMLSHNLWVSRFGSDAMLLGTEVPINGRPTTVIGVMPEKFGFPIAEQFWLPLRIDLTTLERGAGRLDVFGRLRDGVTIERARAEFEGIAGRLSAAYPDSNAGIVASLRSFTEEYVGPEFTQTVYRMLAGAFLVLLVCCANVANLLLIRGAQRRRALAVRMSLGATHGHLVRQLMAEALSLALIGAGIGVGIAAYGVKWFDRAGSQAGVFALPHGSDSLFWWDVSLNVPTLLAVICVTGLTAVLAGLLPALRVSRSISALQSERSDAAAVGATGFATSLVVAQLGLTCGLLVAAGFVGQSVLNMAAADTGFDGDGVFVTRVDLPVQQLGVGEDEYPDHASRLRFAERLIERLESDPSVVAATVTTEVPLDEPSSIPFRVEGDATADRDFGTGIVTVSPSYFSVFGVEASEGRVFDASDRAGGVPVAIVNETFAELYLAGLVAVGSRVRLGEAEGDEPWLSIVGVVPDLWHRAENRAREAGVYVPLAQSGTSDPTVRLGRWGLRFQTVALRAREGGTGPADVARMSVYQLDSSLPVRQVRSMDDVVGQRMGRYRIWGRFYFAFAAAALLLAALGIYGMLSFGVTVRTAEIGVRRALGASSWSVQVEVLWLAAKRIAAGLLLGLLLGWALVGGLTRVLYGVETNDPRVFVTVIVLLTSVALLASWIPARRAARIDPLVAIRHE